MADKGDGEGEGSILKLENQIAVLKYVLLFTNVLEWIIGAAIFALCLWLRFEPGINEWLTILNASNFYIGIYILVIVAAIIMVVSFLGCLSSLQENATIILGVS
ncbi:hypothetical protein HUJ04_008081 [Dendroctonus ponderosae]|uniref:Tetraspanin n=1 Tax=Dendroctonus ponderosae TaxID=77166 RepID=A0AAR5QC52_DENPD|nr:hypothetical protein HUJ04_008081 [Dendroctonus ponderosae]